MSRRKLSAVPALNPQTARAAASIAREVVRQQQNHYVNNKPSFVTGARLRTENIQRSTSTRRTAQSQQTMTSNTVGVPAAVGAVVRMAPTAQKGTLIKHSELFGSVVGTSAFNVTAYQINPGLADLFPWLAKIAHNYDLYHIRNMTITYKVLTGTDTEGAVYIGFDPDALDPAPTSKTQLMSYGSAMSGPVWREITFKFPASVKATRYVRRGSVSGSTLHTYDAGTFFIATENCPVQALGDLYIDYEIELALPHVVSADYGHYRTQHLTCTAGTVTESLLAGTLPHSYVGDRIVDPSRTVYPGVKEVTFTLQEVDSYNDAGVRKWCVVFEAFLTGTGLLSATIIASDSTATVTEVADTPNAAATVFGYRAYVVYTLDPVGTTIKFGVGATTVVTAAYTLFVTPGSSAIVGQT